MYDKAIKHEGCCFTLKSRLGVLAPLRLGAMNLEEILISHQSEECKKSKMAN